MHVAISGFGLGTPSGANRRLLAIVGHAAPLLAPGERLTVLHRAGFAPPEIAGVGWQPVPIAAAPSLRRVRDERRLLPAVLRELDVDLLDHGFLPLPRLDRPCCLLLHDLRAVDGFTRRPRWLARAIVRRACARAAAVVVPSAFTAARLGAVAPGCVPEVIRNGTELPPLPPPPPPTSAATGYLLHVGHLEPRKNVAIVLQALALLPAAARPDLVLAGADAGSARTLRRLASRLGIAAQVQFRGRIADDELHRLGAGARAFVMPSVYEGFGLPALDALALGRPALVADAGALPEVVGPAGTVLPPHDAAAWAAAIAATRDGDDLRQARRARAAQFPWAAAAAATLALWRRLAGDVSARAR
jgi:glycosyltransferase involved in cell wall biosynthesis